MSQQQPTPPNPGQISLWGYQPNQQSIDRALGIPQAPAPPPTQPPTQSQR